MKALWLIVWATLIFGNAASGMCNQSLESNISQLQLSEVSKQKLIHAALDFRRDFGEHTQGLTAEMNSTESSKPGDGRIATIQFLRNGKAEGWTMQISFEVVKEEVVLKAIRFRGITELQK